jgi:hypothetical protein
MAEMDRGRAAGVSSAYELSQGRTIDYPTLEEEDAEAS